MSIENIIVDKIFYLLIIILIGFIAAKLKVITEEVNKGISKLIFNITFPILIFTTFASKDLSFQIITNCIVVLIFSYLALIVLFGFGYFSAKLQKMNRDQKIIHVMHTTHGNIAFLGFPIIGSIYGSEGLLYASIFILANDSILWSLGIFMLNYKNNTSIKKGLLHLINPNTIALFIGLLFMFFTIKIPPILLKPFTDLGHITIIISMLYIGAMLSFVKVHKIFRHYNLYVLCLNKLILVPVIMTFIFSYLIKWFTINVDVASVSIVILETAMPAMATVAILAKEYNGDYEQATENMLVTTIASLFTIPWIIIFINQYLKF